MTMDGDALAEELARARGRVVAEARRWVGTPYHHLGDVHGPGGGVDCAMLLVRCFVDTGVLEPFDPRPYSHQWHLHRDGERYLGWLEQHGVPTATPVPGDVGVWRFRGRTRQRPFSHGAILVEGDARVGTVVHALRAAGEVCVQRLDEAPLWGHDVMWWSLTARLEQVSRALMEGAHDGR